MAKTLAQLLDDLEPAARRAFYAAVRAIRSDITLARVEAALARGDIPGALDALNLEASFFRPLDDMLRQAVLQGGDHAFEELVKLTPRNTVLGRFDASNPRAVDVLARFSADRVVEITEATREGLRTALASAMETDASPRSVALDIVGRLNRSTGRREGGMIGLNSQRIEWLQSAQSELRSGDPAQMRNYLTRKSRDRRFDGAVRRAIRAGKPVPSEVRGRIERAMASRLLRDRGEAIARTELLGSLHAGQDEGLRQAIAKGQLQADQVTVEWDASADKFTRLSHRAMDGERRPYGQPFVSPITGAMLRYPGDTGLGAPAAEVINCRCHLRIRVDKITGLRNRLTAEELAEVRAAM
ncbi:MAG: head morphogenesis protein [Rhodobacteraceae bacterium]|nr:head morphogenesis protein [Paracoccaceae bacterium]